MVTWDPGKLETNIAKHGLSFEGADAVFDHPVVDWEDDRKVYGELRINLLGWLTGRLVHVTYTERGEAMHIISLREAEAHEIKRYIKSISK
jgi:uncharacterized protein